MIRTVLCLGAAAALLVSVSAHAQLGVTADLGTTGVGGHLVVPMGGKFNARFGAGYLSHSFDGSASTIDYNIDGKLRMVDALLDWFPAAGSGFRLSAGVVYDGNKFDFVGTPSAGRYRINGVNYSALDVGVLKGSLDYSKLAPYLGIGYGNAPAASAGWGFAADLGAYYQGKGDARLNSVGCTANALVCQAIARDVAVEQSRFADQVSDVPKLYPVLRASLSYKF
ncbi:MAG: histidine kinase [Massilia sp.]|nr:histidine kinase [Massilia sp.]